MAPRSSTIAWKIPWTEGPGRLQSTGSQTVRHDSTTKSPPKTWEGDSPSFPLPASGLASILGLWLEQSSLCLYPHGASPPWASPLFS